MSFAPPPPVITNFTVACNGYGANTACFDGNANLFASGQAVFSWSVMGATRYEVYGSNGLMYSGGGSSFDAARQVSYGSFGTGVYTLRAYNGSTVTVRQVAPRPIDVTENGPSG